ncbi:GNAT family N-acetyltransferase [Brevibacillus sp. B_LB10_24]|uniref:GNAT family N-acetyltransferase n=1 Tax=Brevibacillus sp. B_LB10_24 TaxID=3380645 RepID=UPI0038B7AF56
MITVKRLCDCSLSDITQAWNRGFEGYYFPVSMTVESLIGRLAAEGYTPSVSVVAFADGEPVGLAASGIRTINSQKVAWNGGTGVATEYRRQGVGRRLVEAALELYREEGVDVATLEAVSQNDRAIALYRQLGYEVTDRLVFWERTDGMSGAEFGDLAGSAYRIRRGIPQEAAALSYYRSDVPWQNQWQSVRDGEAVFVEDEAKEVIGYALYKRTLDETGEAASIVLRQCAARPGRQDEESIIRYALGHVFAPLQRACRRTTFNQPASQETVLRILAEAGFQSSGMEQVYMKRKMK